MRRLKLHKVKNRNTIMKNLLIVFFCLIISNTLLINIYSSKVSKKASILASEQIDEILYQFFNELITNDVINKSSVKDILEINKNEKGEILSVNYDLEKTYTILTDVTKVLKDALINLESGKIDVSMYNKYLESGKNGLILKVPLFLGSDNIFITNLGPRIPIVVNFNETFLTNVKTKVTNYGFNNALLEVYITVEMQKLMITPLKKDNSKFHYNILVSSLVVNGSVPEFYGGTYESSSGILDIT